MINIELLTQLRMSGKTWSEIAKSFPGNTPNACRKAFYRNVRDNKTTTGQGVTIKLPKVLILDVELAPNEAHVWGAWDQNIGTSQMITGWSILSFSAKWLGSKQVVYADTSKQKNVRDDKAVVKQLRDLMDAADFVCGQNSKAFDVKKINARIAKHRIKKPSKYEQFDTKCMAKKHFGFTYNSLEHLSEELCVKYKKLSHSKFPGHVLWRECLKGNKVAWAEMEKYNIHDTLATEELLTVLLPWESEINLDSFILPNGKDLYNCDCGSVNFIKKRKHLFNCVSCGKEHQGKLLKV